MILFFDQQSSGSFIDRLFIFDEFVNQSGFTSI